MRPLLVTNIGEGVLDQVTKSLSDYNPEVKNIVVLVADGIRDIGIVILMILLLIEFINMNDFYKRNGGGMTNQIMLSIGFKYFVALFLILASSQILDTLVFLVNGVTKYVANSASQGTVSLDDNFNANGIIGGMATFFFFLIYSIADFTAKILIFIRYLQLYMLFAIAPVIVCFWMSDGLRNIAVNLIRHFLAYLFQGTIIVLILVIFPSVVNNDFFTANGSGIGHWDWWGAFISGLGKAITLIIVLIGSQRFAKSIMGAS